MCRTAYADSVRACPGNIAMFARAELGSILDPGNDLRCSEYAITVFCELVYMASAQSFVQKKVDVTPHGDGL